MPSTVVKSVGVSEDATKKGRNSLKKNCNQKDFGGPQRARSAYFIFNGDERDKIMDYLKKEAATKGENMKIADVGKALSEKWKALDEHTKNLYYEKAKQEKEEFETRQKEWKETEEFKNFEKAKKKLTKDRKKANDQIKQEGMPKRPQNAYFMFSHSIMKEAMAHAAENKKEGENRMGVQARYVKEKYEGLSAEQKQVWSEKAAAEKVKYVVQMEEFKKSDAYKQWEIECSKAKGVNKRKSSMKKSGGEKKQKTSEAAESSGKVFDSDDEGDEEDEAEE